MHSKGMPTGADIKQTREFLGESQAQFGARFGVDQSTVHRWEAAGAPRRGPARVAIERMLNEVNEQRTSPELSQGAQCS